MESNDTVYLLKECDAGTKMAISSIEEVIDYVADFKLRDILNKSIEEHEKISMELESLLAKHDSSEKEPSAIAKGMSWLKTNFKLSVNESDATIADLMTEGCNMGIKTLNKYMNQYKNSDNESTNLCKKLISIEDDLCKEMRIYL